MSSRYHHLLLAPLAMAGLFLAGPRASEAARYGTPSITVQGVGKTVVQVRVQAAPDGAVGGFRVQWMAKSDFDALGGWPAVEDYNLGLVFCQFNGVPTLNTIDGTTTYQLGPNGVATVEVGDIFDETGMYANYDGEMSPGTQYILRVRAEGYGPILPSFWTPDAIMTTAEQTGEDCTYTQGYWKTHPENWPTNSLLVGSVLYNQAQLLAIFSTPAQGNGLVSLAHQVIATLLNLANGATIPLAQQTALNNAMSLIGGLVIPSVGGGYLAPGSTSGLTQVLDGYNNGISGPGHCGVVPVTPTTWSQIKSLYR